MESAQVKEGTLWRLVVVGGHTRSIGKTQLVCDLIAAFPNERANIEQYFRDLKSATRWFNRHVMAMAAPAPLSNLVRAGGADEPSNMQWQTTAAAKAKDKWERKQ